MNTPDAWHHLPRTLKAPGIVEALTVNDDFTDRRTDLPALLKYRRPAFLGAQETKRTKVDQRVTHALGSRYGVRQDRRNEGAAGVAVAWDRVVARALGHSDDPEELGGGWLELLPAGDGLLARGVVWQDLRVRLGWVGNTRIRLASSHRPPRRNANQWPSYDDGLARWADDSPLPVLLLMDSNEPGGPAVLSRLTGMRWRGVGIDGALHDPHLEPRSAALRHAVSLPRRHSDHHAVSIPIRL